MTEKKPSSETTHFGYQEVPVSEKVNKVAAVFDSVAAKYDLMNDLMSLGLHRYWKRFAIGLSGARSGQHILDIAGGTGDLASRLAEKVGSTGRVCLVDINAAMLNRGRERLIDRGIVGNVFYTQANAERLPFADNTFDCVTMAFGLRNVTQKENALSEIFRVLKPGGRLLVLEFSKPVIPLLATIYERYSFSVLPKLGEWVVGDADSYRYLVESIRMHPDQLTLKNMFTAAGFEQCDYFNLSGGIVALHRGYKF